jgi:hypothetical protein
VDEIPLLGRDDDRKVFQYVQARYDAPAYVRRARQVQAALDELLESLRLRRADWLKLVGGRLGQLHALAGDWSALRPWLRDEGELAKLHQLQNDLAPRASEVPTTSARRLRWALRELTESVEQFNRRWQAFLPTVDLTQVNRLREGYNRYYVLEKECAVRSVRLARQGFQRLDPLTPAQLAEWLPPLPVPQLQE